MLLYSTCNWQLNLSQLLNICTISLSSYKDARNCNIPLIFFLKTTFGNYILMCNSFMEIELKYKDQLLALKLSLINSWPLEFSLLWSVSIKFNEFQNTTRTSLLTLPIPRISKQDVMRLQENIITPVCYIYRVIQICYFANISVKSWHIAFEISMLKVYDRWNEIGWSHRT